MRKHQIFLLLFFVVSLFISCNKQDDPVSPGGSEILDELVSRIESNEYGGAVHSIVIAKNDQIIFERYFNGYSKNTKHALYSVTKSFTSALIGICIDKGYIKNTGMKVADYLPGYIDPETDNDSIKRNITIEHLLTMTAGFSWDEWSTSYGSSNNDLSRLIQSPDWIKYIFNLPLAYAPGTHVTYNSGVSHILSAIISKATGKSTKDFANDNLFKYLDISDWTWSSDPSGLTIGGWGLSLLPTDMVKFGLLYLHKGVYNNRQIISREWIDRSITGYHPINEYCDYGYQWWLYGQRTGSLKDNNIYFAAGRGEQFIWIIPSHNAVAVCTAWNDNQSKLEPVLRDYILKALDSWK